VQVTPPRNNQRTVVNVTILNENGDRIYSDTDDQPAAPGDGAKLIEGREDDRVHLPSSESP
jgi:hypothetical protein